MPSTLSAYDAPVFELPGSVRVALWATAVIAAGGDLATVAPRALPDVDHVAGLLNRLELWRDLGERALLVALPGPADLTSLPRASEEARDAAVEAGEAVLVLGIGGLLVPEHSTFGSSGRRVDWHHHDAAPVPAHRVEALSHRDLERQLLATVDAAGRDLEAAGGQPFVGSLAREVAESRLGGAWGLPDGLTDRAYRVITLAGTVGAAAREGLEHSGALTARSAADREAALRRLAREGDRILTAATNAACAQLAGWAPAR